MCFSFALQTDVSGYLAEAISTTDNNRAKTIMLRVLAGVIENGQRPAAQRQLMGRALVIAVADCTFSADDAVATAATLLLGRALFKSAACAAAYDVLKALSLDPEALEEKVKTTRIL